MARTLRVALPASTGIDQGRLTAAKLIILGPLIAVAGGRWGSYLGIAGTPIFFADLAVGVGTVLFGLQALAARHPRMTSNELVRSVRPNLRVGAACMVGVLVIGLTPNLGSSSRGIDTIRDAIPFLYMLIIPVFVAAVRALGSSVVLRWLRNAAIIHTLWFVPAMAGVLGEISVPFVAGAPVFSTRGDFDVLVCGLAVVLVLVSPGINGNAAFVLIAGNVAAALLSGSRAGLIAAVFIGLVVTITKRPFKDPARGPVRLAMTLIAAVPLILVGSIIINSPPAWAVGLQKLLPNDSAAFQTGQNTAGARANAWRLVISFVNEQGAHWFGLGFGSNPILDSGAVRYLSGDAAVRSAHDFGVTWFAFTGLAGLALVIVAMMTWFGIAVSMVRAGFVHAYVGIGLMGGLVAAGLVGVIMESPFGYTTFALAVGLAAAGADLHRDPSPPLR